MGIHRGPNMEKGGLIFGYDTGYGVSNNAISTRFYPGKPTTNLSNEITKAFSNWSGLVGSTTYYPTKSGGQGVHLITTVGGGVQFYGASTIYGILPNTQYTVSATIKYSGTTPHVNMFYVRQYNNGSQITEGGKFSTGYMVDLENGWYRAYRTFTTTSTTTYINLQGYQYNSGVNLKIQDLQLEIGDKLSPFAGTNGTRSSTESLIDLKRTTDIDLSNTSFDSTGQPTFDGTNDSVLIGNVGGYSNQMTCEAVFKTSSGASWKNMLCGATGDIIFTVNGSKLNFGSQGSNPIPHANYSTTNVNDGNLHHGIATYDGSQVKIYVDGVLESTNNRSGNQTPGSLRVGSNQTGSSEFFNGDLPLVKLYGRALSADEVQQNFNTYKKRFNI